MPEKSGVWAYYPLWAVALELANAWLASEREALDLARQEAEQTRQEAADLADQLAADLDKAQGEVKRLAEQFAGISAEAGTLRDRLQAETEARAAAEHCADTAEAPSVRIVVASGRVLF
jgi:chromosome segregation ATPase